LTEKAAYSGDKPEDQPRIGDRVKLMGSHKWAGYSGTYITDREYFFAGSTRPVVRIDNTRKEVFVGDPETMWRKL
jgi:hypothetical protein